MKTVNVRGVEIGAGVPKICVPIVGVTREEILAQADGMYPLPADVVEWRCDWYEDVTDPMEMASILVELRVALMDRPLLLTFRTKNEGGQRDTSPEAYLELITAGIQSGCVDLVDVELSMGEELFHRVVQEAAPFGVAVVGSSHDFSATPEKEVILSRLKRMEELGADIAKIAVMPRSSRDVLTLLDATLTARETLEIPVVTMSMSGKGVITRMAGEEFGSAMTFGAAGYASAPGQLPVDILAGVLDLLHGQK